MLPRPCIKNYPTLNEPGKGIYVFNFSLNERAVNTIYEYAFMESGLTRVDITSLEAWLGIKFYGEIANPLYVAQHLYLNDVEIKDLVIPNTITEILWSAFHGCTGLTSVTFPSSVKTIGYSAFKGCRGLTDVTIPSSVT